MDTIIWIGPPRSAEDFKTLFAEEGLEIGEYDSVERALAAIAGIAVAIAIVSADWGDATSTIQELRSFRPDVEVLVATRLGVPLHLNLVLQAGASNVLDLQAKDAPEIAKQVREAHNRHQAGFQESQLLLRLRSLNEEFLQNIVNLEKRNVELEQRLLPEEDGLATLFGEEMLALANDAAYRVLLIDDEASVRRLFGLILKDQEYELVTAEDGESGLEAFRKEPFQLVITDKNLPGIDGLEVAREVRKLSPGADVIMITGYGSKESAIDALNRGIVAYLEKPFDNIKEVRKQIDQVITKQRGRAVKQRYLDVFKDRNRAFLEKYRAIRADLEGWLRKRGAANTSAMPGARG